MYNMYGSG